ncbi:NAD-dependent epimerase/dehydratase family protein [Romboutsia sp.]|uniref:NAD-dependent epimerase/dehydratase family protein n=1 Tax=Romboutsia sp. TaxID=1965302 RepID=UPI003F2EFB23
MRKKYLVTGANGFIGSCIVRKLINDNQEVHILARKESDDWRLKDLIKYITIHYIDLNDENTVKDFFYKQSFNVVFHLAAYGVYHFQKDIDMIINTNLTMTWNLVKACQETGVEIFINTSSSSEYGEKIEPMKEDMVLEPNSMYGATKAASTILCSTYAKLNKMQLCTVRLLSPYGYFDASSRLIPTVIRGCLENKDIYLGSKTSKRDFIFIEDVVEAYLKISNSNDKFGEVYNLGSGVEYTVETIVNKIMFLTNSKSNLHWGDNLGRQYEPKYWFADISKIKSDLSWSPKVDIDSGLRKTIEWFEKNKNLYS